MNPYILHPAVHKDSVYFCFEDDLWVVSKDGGSARRLSSHKAQLSRPLPSPDGSLLAIASEDEGVREVALFDLIQGSFERWSYFGSGNSYPIQWRGQDRLVVGTPAFHMDRIHEAVLLHRDGRYEPLKLGPVTHLAWDDHLGIVIERNSHRPDPAHWKGYRGGTRGRFLWGRDLSSDFVRCLPDKDTNLSRPLWAKGRLFFTSDQKGIGQLCSVKPDGSDLKVHTKSSEFYVRNPQTDGRSVVFHQGGDLGVLDLQTGRVRYPKVNVMSSRQQGHRKWVGVSNGFEDLSLSPEGKQLAFVSRGQIQIGDAWNGGVWNLNRQSLERLRFVESCEKDNHWLVVRAPGLSAKSFPVLDDLVELWSTTLTKPEGVLKSQGLGRVMKLQSSPVGTSFAVINHRNEIWVGDFEKKKLRKVAQNRFKHIRSLSFSPDGRYLAYIQNPVDTQSSRIEILDLSSGKSHPATSLLTHDFSPSFDPGGRFLYALSNRDLDPVYDSIHFDLGFPKTTIAALVVLSQESSLPWIGIPSDPLTAATSKNSKSKTKSLTRIDFEGLESRMIRLPAPTANYTSLSGLDGSRVLLASEAVSGALGADWLPGSQEGRTKLEFLDLKTKKLSTLCDGVSRYRVSKNGKVIAYSQGARVRVVAADSPLPEGSEPSRKSGWVPLERFGSFVNPSDEWKQIFSEVWRLQKENFWDPTMEGIDWVKAWTLYSPLVNRIGSRSELSDLIWELQGELGTSHAYDIGGDYRRGPFYSKATLGADWAFRKDQVIVDKIIHGDSWDPQTLNPLKSPGVDVKKGDWLVSINGQLVTPQNLGSLLLNRSSQEVELVFERSKKKKSYVVHLGAAEPELRYRDWVQKNLNWVHQKSKSRVGYIHIPDMGASGFSEFHRHFVSQVNRDALLVDLRFNGGGHVSQLLLEKLARKRLGFSRSRHFGDMPFPDESPTGVMLALTNEYAGSDGDIGSHTFKMRGLGLLVGKRTWGGVVGIWPQQILVDGSVTTQPEFGHWVYDSQWKIENYGTDPDLEVDNWPQDYRAGRDAQLERGLELLLESLEGAQPWDSKSIASEKTGSR